MDYIIDNEIQEYLTAPTNEERGTLESLILDGYHVDPVVIAIVGSERILADGHTRREICMKHGIELPTREKEFSDRESLIQWVIDNQMGRRNLTEERKAYYRGKEYLNKKKQVGKPTANGVTMTPLGRTSETVAEKHGVSPETVKRDAAFAEAVDELTSKQKQAVLNGFSGETKKSITEGATPILCGRCKRIGAVKDCPQCEEARKVAKSPKTLAEKVAADLAEPQEEKPDPTIEEIIAEKNSVIESFCRKVMKLVNEELPDDPWLEHMNRRGSALQKFKDACETLRSTKCHCACPMCKGGGCSRCHKTGRVTLYAYQQLVG